MKQPDEVPQSEDGDEPSLFQETLEEAEADKATCEEVIDRIESLIGDDSRSWERISSTAESVTVALDVRVGSLVRVISWDLDGNFHMTTTWCHGVTIDDLRHGTHGQS